MREDDLAQVLDGQFHLEDGLRAPDHLGGVRAQHVDAQHLVGRGVNEDLRLAGGLEAVLRDEAAGHEGGDLGDEDVAALALGGGLGQTDARGLGDREDGPRDGVPAHDLAALLRGRVEDVCRGDLRHAVGGVRQEGASGDVADGPHVGQVGAHRVVDDDAAVDLEAGLFGAPAHRRGTAANGHEDHVGLDTLLFLALGVVDGAPVEGLDAAAQLEGHVLHGGAGLGGQVVVHERQDLGSHLDDGHLRTQGGVQGGELDTDDAAADDREAGGDLGQGQDARGVDQRRIVLGAGQRGHGRLGARGDDDVVRGVGRALDGHATGGVEVASSVDDGDARLTLGGCNARDQALNDLIFPGLHLRPVNGNAAGVHTELAGFLGVQVVLRAVEQGLGGDAAHVQAGAAQVLFLDEGNLLARVSEALGGQVAAGARTEDDDVKMRVTHECSSFLRPGPSRRCCRWRRPGRGGTGRRPRRR